MANLASATPTSSSTLQGKTALVTGSALGIGAGIARIPDAQGAHAIVTGLTEQEGANSDYEAHIFDIRETKAAHMSFVRSPAIELAPQCITVNAVLPGSILPLPPESMTSVRNSSPT